MKNKFLITALIFSVLGILSASFMLFAGSSSGLNFLSKDSITQGNSNSGVTPVEVIPVNENKCDSVKNSSGCCKKQCDKSKCEDRKGKCCNNGTEVPIGKNPYLNSDTAVNNSVPQKDK